MLNQLGVSMSNAIGFFLRQVVLQRGIPFDMKIPADQPLAMGDLSGEQLGAEIERGFRDLAAGKVIPADRLVEDLHRDYGL